MIDVNLDWQKDRKRSKKIDVDGCRVEWDRKGEIEKDRRVLWLTKR